MATTIQGYPAMLNRKNDGTIDWDSHTFKVMLLNNSAAFNNAHTVLADVSANEIASGSGYTTGGQALANASLSRSGSVITFDSDDPTWNAAGGALEAYKAVLFDDSVASPIVKPLCFFVDFGGLLSAPDGAPLIIRLPAGGWWQETLS